MARAKRAVDRNEAIRRLNSEYTLFPWTVQGAHSPIVVAGGKGARFWDANGKVYLDFASQLVNVNAGHQHPRIIAAIKEQAEKLCYAAPTLATEARGELARLIAEVTPGDLKRSYFALGGSDAIDSAIKLARLYTGRHKIISRYRSYHGATFGAMTVSGDSRRWAFEPGIPGVVRVFDPYCYRCVFGKEPLTCGLECVGHIEEVVALEGPHTVAAVLIEAVTGSNGVHVPVPRYMPELRRLCDKYGLLLIDDEVMSGWGRTGEWFAVNHWKVVPDMLVTAKGVTSGHQPLSVVVVSDAIGRFFDDKPLASGFTSGGHALACAAGIACIGVYRDERLIDNSRAMGEILARELARLKDRHPSVGDVRSLGLFAAVELVRDRLTKEPFGTLADPSPMAPLYAYLAEQGIYAFGRANTLVLAPPLCISESELLEGLAALDGALGISDSCTQAAG